jgi:transglutaminase-like putative cysteine protease
MVPIGSHPPLVWRLRALRLDSRAYTLPGALSGSSPTIARLHGISDGPSGALQTMVFMRQLVLDAVRDPSQNVRDLALKIIGSAGYVGQVRAIQLWVQQNIRYVRDPTTIELVQTPQKTLQWTAGDCDDQSVLVASLLDSIGHPAQFMAMGFKGGPLEHVLTRTKIGAQWVAVETIKPVSLGFLPPNITSTYIRDI